MSTKRDYDIIVAGGGLAGLIMASSAAYYSMITFGQELARATPLVSARLTATATTVNVFFMDSPPWCARLSDVHRRAPIQPRSRVAGSGG